MSNQDIRFDLNRGETQLWAGAPRQGFRLRPADILMLPFGIMWTGFAVYWETMVVRSNGPFFMQLWGIPFILIGVYMILGRFIADARRLRNTVYGLTSDRVIISAEGNTLSLPLSSLGDVSLVERPDGSGTIVFGASADAAAMLVRMPSMGPVVPPAFEMIPDANAVYAKLRDAQQAAKQSTPNGGTTASAAAPASSFVATTRPARQSGFRALFLLMFAGAGGFFAYKGAADVYAGIESANWPSTGGTVLDSRMATHRGSGRNGGTTYSADVSYMYSVSGRSFIGNQIAFGHLTLGTGSRQTARQLAKYARGARVDVHYDAAHPERAVLEAGWTGGSVFMAVLGSVFVLVGVGAYRLIGRAQQGTRPPVSDMLAMRRQDRASNVGR